MNVSASKTKNGFTIIEILVAMGLTLLLAIAAGSVLLETRKSQNRLAADSTRTIIANSIKFSASNAMALKAAAERAGQPALLLHCFCGRAACTSNTSAEFTLTNISGVVLAGTTATPQRYDISGNVCAVGAQNCRYEATARFECKGTQCGTGTFLDGDPVLRVTYQLRLTSATQVTNKEFSYLKDVQSLPVDSSIKSMRRYAATLCP